MRGAKWLKQTKREFFRERRKDLRATRKAVEELRVGCGMLKGLRWEEEIYAIDRALNVIEAVLKKVR